MPFKDKEFHAKWRRARIKDNQAWVREFKESLPCTDCGLNWPYYVMQFDHLHGKKNDISKMMAHSAENILAEMAKCELVCANCHAIRSHNRMAGLD